MFISILVRARLKREQIFYHGTFTRIYQHGKEPTRLLNNELAFLLYLLFGMFKTVNFINIVCTCFCMLPISYRMNDLNAVLQISACSKSTL